MAARNVFIPELGKRKQIWLRLVNRGVRGGKLIINLRVKLHGVVTCALMCLLAR